MQQRFHERFHGVLYGGQLPLSGVEATAGFVADTLQIPSVHTLATGMQVVVRDIALRVGGFDHDELYLDWQDADGTAFSLKVGTSADIACVIASAPPVLQAQMKHWHHRRRSIRVVWSSLGTLAVMFVLSAGLLWWRYDDALDWAASRISVENERLLGDHALEQIEADADIIREGPAVEAIASIGQRLTQHSRYQYQWLVQRDNTVNAFALPGGIIVVNSTLVLNTDSPEELAAVLAHEVQHVEERHTLKSMLNSLGFATVLLVVLGDVNAATAIIVHQMGNMYVSRDVEEQADEKGFQSLVSAGISPVGMVSFLKKLQNENSDAGTGAIAWLSTHPETQKRIDNIQDLYNREPCNTCQLLDFDWESVLADPSLVQHASR
jgi:Zn-dependent protease with chaperone function